MRPSASSARCRGRSFTTTPSWRGPGSWGQEAAVYSGAQRTALALPVCRPVRPAGQVRGSDRAQYRHSLRGCRRHGGKNCTASAVTDRKSSEAAACEWMKSGHKALKDEQRALEVRQAELSKTIVIAAVPAQVLAPALRYAHQDLPVVAGELAGYETYPSTKWRPFLNSEPSPIAATIAGAVFGPTPLLSAIRWQGSLSRNTRLLSLSNGVIRRSGSRTR